MPSATALFRSLQHRSFTLLWTGQTISRFGDGFYSVALAWWVLKKTNSATAMGAVLICSMAPMLLFLLVGGVMVDRLSRKYVMLASDLLSGFVLAIVSLLVFNNQLEIWHVYIASALLGTINAFFEPAYAALVPQIVPADMLPSANSLTSLSRQVAGIGGPALGGVVVTLGDSWVAFALNAASFLISAVFLAAIPNIAALPIADSARTSVVRDLREGVTAVLRSPWLWITISVAALSNITQGNLYLVTLPFLVSDTLKANADALGLLYALFFIGSLASVAWLGRFTRIRHRGWLAYGAAIVGGLMTFALGLPIGLAGAALAIFVCGLAIAALNLIWIGTLQELVAPELLGRVVSIDLFGSYLLLPVGLAVAGWATQQLGAPMVFMIGGALAVGIVLLALTHPAIRGMD